MYLKPEKGNLSGGASPCRPSLEGVVPFPVCTDCSATNCHALLSRNVLKVTLTSRCTDAFSLYNDTLMYRANRSFNMPPPPGQPLGHLTFLKTIVQMPPYPGQNTVQMPHTGVHSGDQMPPTLGTFHRHKNDRRTAETPSVVEQNLYKYIKK